MCRSAGACACASATKIVADCSSTRSAAMLTIAMSGATRGACRLGSAMSPQPDQLREAVKCGAGPPHCSSGLAPWVSAHPPLRFAMEPVLGTVSTRPRSRFLSAHSIGPPRAHVKFWGPSRPARGLARRRKTGQPPPASVMQGHGGWYPSCDRQGRRCGGRVGRREVRRQEDRGWTGRCGQG